MSNGKTKPRATSFDRALGLKIKEVRTLKGITQATMGEYLGVTFQQVQKYEKGENRISAHNLAKMAKIFEVTIDSLLRDIRL